MYRILSASKDTYITNKYVAGSSCTTSNVGQAGTLDLYKLYDETTVAGVTSSIVEFSRILVKFDYTPLVGVVDPTDPTLECRLSMRDVYGGQTVPSNFEISLYPLSKSFDEGRGSDVVSLRDLDTANWLSASSTAAWVSPGADASGSFGDSCDILVGTGLGAHVIFERGDEDMSVVVTDHVSASLAGMVENHGFRLSLTSSLENDTNTYFVKRFGSRQAYDRHLQPRMIVKYNDCLQDSNGDPQLNVSQSLFVYNPSGTNFFSGSTELVGSNCMTLVLEASRSYTYMTSSWSISHSASINHLTKSVARYTTEFSASQVSTGIYSSSFNLSSFEPALNAYLSGSNKIEFKTSWKSVDGTVTFASNYGTFTNKVGNVSNVANTNWVINITNLRSEYLGNATEPTRLRVFAYDYNTEQVAGKLAAPSKSEIIRDMRWRIKEAYTKQVLIPFDEYTKLSYDGDGMYFDLYTSDLDVGQVYQIDFLVKDHKDTFIENAGFRFKVVST